MGKGKTGLDMNKDKRFSAKGVKILLTMVLGALSFLDVTHAQEPKTQDLGEVLALSECRLYAPRIDDVICTVAVVPLEIKAIVVSRRPVSQLRRNGKRIRRRIRRRVFSDADGHLTSLRRNLPAGSYRIRLVSVRTGQASFSTKNLLVAPRVLKVGKAEPQFLAIQHKDWDEAPIVVDY